MADGAPQYDAEAGILSSNGHNPGQSGNPGGGSWGGRSHLPLTASDRSEWGDPLTSEAVLACIRSYSPYENLTAQTYPPVLVTVRTHDTRVPPVQALKYAQRFRRDCSGGPVILLPEAGGHTGGASLHDSLQAHALQLAWISVHLGLDLQQTPSESTISL